MSGVTSHSQTWFEDGVGQSWNWMKEDHVVMRGGPLEMLSMMVMWLQIFTYQFCFVKNVIMMATTVLLW